MGKEVPFDLLRRW